MHNMHRSTGCPDLSRSSITTLDASNFTLVCGNDQCGGNCDPGGGWCDGDCKG